MWSLVLCAVVGCKVQAYTGDLKILLFWKIISRDLTVETSTRFMSYKALY